MQRNSTDHDVEAPLLGQAGSDGTPRAASGRGLSPNRVDGGLGTGSIRIRRAATMPQEEPEQAGGLVVKDVPEGGDSGVRELEVEVVAGAVAEAVAEAVQEAVQEAVHDAVQQAIEENVQFDVRANVYTLIAVTGVILFWRGVWNAWDSLFGTGLASNLACMGVGLIIMSIIRLLNLPLVEGLPGG